VKSGSGSRVAGERGGSGSDLGLGSTSAEDGDSDVDGNLDVDGDVYMEGDGDGDVGGRARGRKMERIRRVSLFSLFFGELQGGVNLGDGTNGPMDH
jgi:hypothetical protein